MPDNNLAELAHLQFEEAKEILKFIPIYITSGDYNGAISRAYYAAFHALKALELLEGFDSKSTPALLLISDKHTSKQEN